MFLKFNGINLLRCLAIICVIVVHVCNFSGINANFSWSPESLNNIFSNDLRKLFLIHFIVFDIILYHIFYAPTLILYLKYFYIPFATIMIFMVSFIIVFYIKKIPYIRAIV
jgi:hypothetical protein